MLWITRTRGKSFPAIDHKRRYVAQMVGPLVIGRQRVNRRRRQSLGFCFRTLKPKEINKSRLAFAFVFLRCLANRRGIRLNIQNVIGNLERQPDMIRILKDFPGISVYGNGRSRASEPEQRTCLPALHCRNFFQRRKISGFGFDIQHLSAHHARRSSRLREFQYEIASHSCIGMGGLRRQDFKCQCQQGVTRQYGRCVIKLFVDSWQSPPQIVIVHGRKVIMYKGVTMHTLQRRANTQGIQIPGGKNTRTFNHQKGPEPFALTKRPVAHGLANAASVCRDQRMQVFVYRPRRLLQCRFNIR